MKALTTAMLIPLAICAACGIENQPPAMAAASPAGVPGAAAVAGPGAAASAAPATAPPSVRINLTSAPGSAVKGDLTLANAGGAVSIRGEITGLSPGKEHGFHVHEVGQCALPDFQSAGGHFNPTKDEHGGPKSKARHLGDIPNIQADANGRATLDFRVEGVTLQDKDGAPTEIHGKAPVVHAMADDYKSQPSGDSGARIACGVIR